LAAIEDSSAAARIARRAITTMIENRRSEIEAWEKKRAQEGKSMILHIRELNEDTATPTLDLVPITVRIPIALQERIHNCALAQNTSVATLIVQAFAHEFPAEHLPAK
jgi:hypothetical protein